MSGAVLITRPSPAAEAFRTTLALRGMRALLAPLLTYHPATSLPPPASYEGVIFTSATAIRFCNISLLPAGWADLPCYCVGSVTAEAARAQGWRRIRQGATDGAALATVLQAEQPAGGNWLHICGQERHAEPATSLQAAGYQLTPWVVYRAEAAEQLPAATLAACRAGQVAVVTFFSARTAHIFVALAQACGLAESCRAITALSFSAAIAAIAAPLPWRDNQSAPAPTEAAMLSSLQNLLRR